MGDLKSNENTLKLFQELNSSFRSSTNSWTVRQNNALDAQTNFIYSINSLAELHNFFRQDGGLSMELRLYAEHRWRNFKRHDAWLSLIIDLWPSARLTADSRDRTKDFSVQVGSTWLDFDLKVTRYPKSAAENLDNLQLAQWMYFNQSTQSRYHLNNRVFVVASPEASIYEYALAFKVISDAGLNLEKNVLELSVPGKTDSTKSMVLRV